MDAESSQLTPSLRAFRVVAIALAAISPTTSMFLVYGSGLELAGTAVPLAFLLAAFVAASMAFAYAELGAMHPGAGGAYTIVRQVLGPMAGWVALCLFLVLGVISTAAILVASATYFHELVGAVPVRYVAMVMMAGVTLLSLERLTSASWLATAMLWIELVVILAFIVATAVGAHHGLGSIAHPTSVDGAPVGSSAVLAAIALALFAYNGYDWPLYFAEETHEPRRVLPRAVLLAAGLAIVIELAAVVTATLAIDGLRATAGADSPLAEIARQVTGTVGSKILLVGVVVAMFDTGLTANFGYARIYFASGRDDLWPTPVSRFLASTNANAVPKGALLLLFVGCEALCFFTSLTRLITFTSVVIALIYTLIAVCAIVSRRREASAERPFRMPVWPLPPLIALVGIALAVRYQTGKDILITGVVAASALVYWLAYGARRRARLERSTG